MQIMRNFPFFRRLAAAQSGASFLTAVPPGVLKTLLTMMFLSLFLVGSCKTADLAERDQAAALLLLPEPAPDAYYTPAKGYTHTARRYLSGHPEGLMHMTEMQISYLFGAPSARRGEQSLEIWQYRTQNCLLDIHFSRHADDAAGNAKAHRQVSYYALRQLDTPDWMSDPAAADGDILPSKIRTSDKTRMCMEDIFGAPA